MNELELHNTLINKKQKFKPINDNKVGMYVCGVTVYDRCHLGHARAVVFFDIVYRFMRELGYDVTFVRNFTDIDDKIIKRANEENIPWQELTEKYIAKFHKDFGALNIESPTFEPKATEHIDDIIEAVSILIDKGFAYEKNGDVYYRVRKFLEYGKLSGRSIDDLQVGARIEVNDIKEDPLDFAVWKKSKENEPYWDSPWGKGRPGWHIECSAMSRKYLGEHFDIHGGGHDLIFPHHENEIAQSEAISGEKFVNYWVHNGFVTINKEKMSKSTGNFFALEDIYKEYEPRILRLFLLSRHYRVPLDYSTDLLVESKKAWTRVENCVRRIEDALNSAKNKFDSKLDNEIYQLFMEYMCDDFNTTRAVSLVFDLVTKMNQQFMQNKIDQVLSDYLFTLRKICDVLGIEIQPSDTNSVSLKDISSYKYDDSDLNVLLTKDELQIEDIKELVLMRGVARQNKNFGQADKIRDKLSANKIVLRDMKNQTEIIEL